MLVKPEPARPAEGWERWLVAAFTVFIMGSFTAEVAHDFTPIKLSIVFMMLYLGPLIAVHEAAHALTSHALGWRVCRIVVGYGRTLLTLRFGRVPVELRMLPIGGHVVPAPTRLRNPRLESALIYAAGPAGEALVAGIAIATIGSERLFTRSDSVELIAVQSLIVLIGIDLFMNLIPLPAQSESRAAYTDGLGVLMSALLPDWHFRRAMTLPWVLRAEASDSKRERVEIFREGVMEQPQNPFMRLRLCEALFAAGDAMSARSERLEALKSPYLPESVRFSLGEGFG